jgi:hypothetical protein
MSWQDAVLSVGEIIFAIALLPSILSKDKPALATSILNAAVLFIMGFVDLTISLYGTAGGLFLVGILWTILAVQKYLDK